MVGPATGKAWFLIIDSLTATMFSRDCLCLVCSFSLTLLTPFHFHLHLVCTWREVVKEDSLARKLNKEELWIVVNGGS